jgi:serine protease inhibitor
LNDALKSLGMRTPFDPQTANFGAMLRITANVYISTVKHKAFAEVNEEGTEAAAATSTEIRVVSMQRPIEMIVNRPFFFAIRDNATGAVLFLGSINNPRS